MKFLSKLILFLLLAVFALSSISFAMEVDCISNTDVSENINIITPEEYYQMIAEARTITVKEAKKITMDIIKEHQCSLKEQGKSQKNNDEIN